MILANGELDEGGFLIFAMVIGVLHINSDDLVALELEVLLVLLDGGRRLVQVVGVDHVQLCVAWTCTSMNSLVNPMAWSSWSSCNLIFRGEQ